ncbi:MAG: RNA-binding protein [Actinobacteria bacterium]|nr:RNA-binding protein [Actinomycetota bacterium]
MNKRLYVGNLDYSTSDDELKELFSAEGNVVYAKVVTRMDGKSRGFGFVEMETEDEAKNAAEKFNQSTYKNRTIVVNEAKNRERSSPPRDERSQFRSRRDSEDFNSKLKKLRRKFS